MGTPNKVPLILGNSHVGRRVLRSSGFGPGMNFFRATCGKLWQCTAMKRECVGDSFLEFHEGCSNRNLRACILKNQAYSPRSNPEFHDVDKVLRDDRT